jgi:hypothetical protein
MNINSTAANTQKMMAHKAKSAVASATTMRREEVNLRDTGMIDVRACSVLNASTEHAQITEVLDEKPSRVLLSDVDEQLLFRVVFDGVAAISCIRFKVPSELPEDSSSPLSVKVYVNRESMDFGDAEDLAPVATRTLEFADGEAKFPVSGPNFSRVSSLQVLVESNAEDTEKTVVSQLSVMGHLIPQYM